MLEKIAVLAVAAALFTLMERLFSLRRDQRVLRAGYGTDVLHLLLSHTLAQVGLVIAIGLLFGALSGLVDPALQARVAAQPAWLQLVEAVLITDVCAYAVHRAAHTVPALWRFHRVHHSSEQLDWLASARVHPVDIVVIRSAQFAPLVLLGFSRETFGAYAVLLQIWAFVLHANVRFTFGPLRWLFATPEFHHWHHANEDGHRHQNFAGQLPLLDALFGTLHLPRRWPTRYGADAPVGARWWTQIASPFRRPSSTSEPM